MKNIVFDLGNVVIDIDFPKTYIALAELSATLSEKEVLLSINLVLSAYR